MNCANTPIRQLENVPLTRLLKDVRLHHEGGGGGSYMKELVEALHFDDAIHFDHQNLYLPHKYLLQNGFSAKGYGNLEKALSQNRRIMDLLLTAGVRRVIIAEGTRHERDFFICGNVHDRNIQWRNHSSPEIITMHQKSSVDFLKNMFWHSITLEIDQLIGEWDRYDRYKKSSITRKHITWEVEGSEVALMEYLLERYLTMTVGSYESSPRKWDRVIQQSPAGCIVPHLRNRTPSLEILVPNLYQEHPIFLEFLNQHRPRILELLQTKMDTNIDPSIHIEVKTLKEPTE